MLTARNLYVENFPSTVRWVKRKNEIHNVEKVVVGDERRCENRGKENDQMRAALVPVYTVSMADTHTHTKQMKYRITKTRED